MDFLKKNYDKAALGAMLILLSLSIVYQIIIVNERLGVPIGGTPKGREMKVEAFERDFTDKKMAATTRKFMDGSNYFYCQNTKCKILHPGNFSGDCAWCGERQVSVGPEEKKRKNENADSDKAGIPDVEEQRLGLDKNDPKDELADKDNDGFSNLEEYEAETAIDDKEEFPGLFTKLYFKDVITKKLDFKIDLITELDASKNEWDIQVTTYSGEGKETDFMEVGSSLPGGYKIVGVNAGATSVEISNGVKSFSVKVGVRPEPPKSERVVLAYTLKGKEKEFVLKKGEIFKLEPVEGDAMEYKLKSYSKNSKSATIFDDVEGDVTLGLAPVEEDSENGSDTSDNDRINF